MYLKYLVSAGVKESTPFFFFFFSGDLCTWRVIYIQSPSFTRGAGGGWLFSPTFGSSNRSSAPQNVNEVERDVRQVNKHQLVLSLFKSIYCKPFCSSFETKPCLGQNLEINIIMKDRTCEMRLEWNSSVTVQIAGLIGNGKSSREGVLSSLVNLPIHELTFSLFIFYLDMTAYWNLVALLLWESIPNFQIPMHQLSKH